MQLSIFPLPRKVISEWSEYQEQSQRALEWYDRIFKWRTGIALVVIFYLTYQYSFFNFFKSLGPDAVNTLSVGLLLAPGIAVVWRVMTIRKIWKFLDFKDTSRWPHSVLFLLTPPVVASAAAWCLIFIAGRFSAWLTSPKNWLTTVVGALGSLVGLVVLVAILVGLPLCDFFVRRAHPMLESVVIMAVTCAIGISQLFYASGGPIPLHVAHVIALSGMASTSAICIAEFLTLYWLGLRLDYIPVKRMDIGFNRERTSMPFEALYGNPRRQRSYRNEPDPREPERRGSGYPVVTITLAGTAIMVWIVVQVMHGAIVNASFGPNPQSSTQEVLPSLPVKPTQGILMVVPNHDYILSIGPPYLVARPGGADVGNVTGTSGGLEINLAYALPLPKKIRGNYASCLNLNWTSANVWSGQHIIGWSQLQSGKQFCVQTTYDGLYLSLLTVVKQRNDDRVSFSVVTWSCEALPAESSIC